MGTEREGETERENQREREPERHRDRESEREKETYTQRLKNRTSKQAGVTGSSSHNKHTLGPPAANNDTHSH